MASPSSKQALRYKCPGGMFPTLGFVLAAHHRAVKRDGSPEEIRDEGVIDSAVNTPVASAGSQDAYPMFFDKVSALGWNLAKNQGFVEGNKRTALIATEATLEWNGHTLSRLNQDAKIMLFSLVGAGHLELKGLRHGLLIGCGLDPIKYLEHETNPGAMKR